VASLIADEYKFVRRKQQAEENTTENCGSLSENKLSGKIAQYL
jgi:hypothetical protein